MAAAAVKIILCILSMSATTLAQHRDVIMRSSCDKSGAPGSCKTVRYVHVGSYGDGECTMPHVRPTADLRAYHSPAVEKVISDLVPRFKSPNLATLWSNCLPNTLDTTVQLQAISDDDVFIVTGDIEAMWLRDSTNQVLPYVPMMPEDSTLFHLVLGLIYRQAKSVLIDAYANAFTLRSTDPSPHADDQTSMPAFAGTRLSGLQPGVYERKYELDSLANVLLLSGRYYEATGALQSFDGRWLSALSRILEVIQTQRQEITGQGASEYVFQREALNPSDTLSHGEMWPNRHTGLIRSAFRPSDDATVYPYHIPANALAVVALRSVAKLLLAMKQTTLHDQCVEIASQVEEAIMTHGVVQHPSGAKVFAYEVDGFGNFLFMDDANMPSLLSLPVFGFVNNTDPIYQATRNLILSTETNPFYFSGPAGKGVGGPHNGVNYIWPMAIMVEAWTATSDTEIEQAVDLLVNSSACTGLMHESFESGSVFSFTRPWFAWANSFFGELILKIAKERPQIILKS